MKNVNFTRQSMLISGDHSFLANSSNVDKKNCEFLYNQFQILIFKKIMNENFIATIFVVTNCKLF